MNQRVKYDLVAVRSVRIRSGSRSVNHLTKPSEYCLYERTTCLLLSFAAFEKNQMMPAVAELFVVLPRLLVVPFLCCVRQQDLVASFQVLALVDACAACCMALTLLITFVSASVTVDGTFNRCSSRSFTVEIFSWPRWICPFGVSFDMYLKGIRGVGV